ncbi:type III secretion system effector ChbP [Burkholderia pseudomallei]|uniref:type III secretion system effector ChbP n=1 Tax=Burkholderia pseudomallei TaxID=28450 RepID=UPI000F047F51|nr:type III secretion system effector ChbP [Burkholderia pseudomallei]
MLEHGVMKIPGINNVGKTGQAGGETERIPSTGPLGSSAATSPAGPLGGLPARSSSISNTNRTGENPMITPIISSNLGLKHRVTLRKATLASLMQSLSGESSNRVMWNDRYDTLLIARDPREIKNAIEKSVTDFGGLENYKKLTGGADPFALMTPVCGLSANNIFKLMTEKDVPIDPTSIEYLENTSFAEHVNTLDSHKNYVVIVNDGRLGHKFLIDLPALTQGPRTAYIIQSDLGGGALPAVRVEDWISRRGSDPVSLDELNQLLSKDFSKMPDDVQTRLLASILQIDKDPHKVDIKKLHLDGKLRFASHEYDFRQFQRNAQYVAGLG